MQVELHPEALAEVRAAAIWYDERQPGLGDRFVSEVAEALARIAEAPAGYSIWVDSGAVRVAVRKGVLVWDEETAEGDRVSTEAKGHARLDASAP